MAEDITDEAVEHKKVTVAQSATDSFADSIIQQQIEKYEANAAKQLSFNPLKVYFGDEFWVTDRICIQPPTIQDYIDFGEAAISNASAPYISNPTSYRVQLWDSGINWNDIDDLDLFYMLTQAQNPLFSSLLVRRLRTEEEAYAYVEAHPDIDVESINWKAWEMLMPMDYSSFILCNKTYQNDDGEEITEKILYSEELDMQIDMHIYEHMSEYIRYIFHTNPEVEHCKSKSLARQLVANEKLKQAKAAQESQGSSMMNLISFALNHPGFKYSKLELRNVNIAEFMDSIQRLQVYESTRALMGGMYSGFCDVSKIDKEQFNFMRDA